MKKRKVTFEIVGEGIDNETFRAVIRKLPVNRGYILWKTRQGFIRVTDISTKKCEKYLVEMEEGKKE